MGGEEGDTAEETGGSEKPHTKRGKSAQQKREEKEEKDAQVVSSFKSQDLELFMRERRAIAGVQGDTPFTYGEIWDSFKAYCSKEGIQAEDKRWITPNQRIAKMFGTSQAATMTVNLAKKIKELIVFA